MARIVKFLVSLPFLLALGAVGVYALGGFIVAPWWVKRELPQLLKTHLNAEGSAGEIAINPFTLSVEVRDFSLTEAGGVKPAIAFDRLFVDFETSSLFRRAWTFADITLERPRVQLEVDANGALNLAKLAPKNESPEKQPSSELPRLLLHKTVLKHGLVTFTDKAASSPATAKLEPIEFELHDLSTLPDQHGEYTLSARLPAGGALGWRGTITLAPMTSTGQLELKSVKLATLWQFARDKLLIEEPGGSAALSLKYAVRYGESKLNAAASDMAFSLNDVTVRQKGAADAMLTAGALTLTGGNFNLIEHKIQFSELAVGKIVANTLLDADGKANWAQLLAPSRNASAPANAPPAPSAGAKPAQDTPWQAGIDAIRISDMQIGVLDHGFVKPVAIHIARSGLQARMKTSLGAQTTAIIDNIAVELDDIRVSDAGAKNILLSLASAKLAGGALDLAQKKFLAESVLLGKPATAITRNANGEIDLVTAFARKAAKPPEPSAFVTEIGAIELTDGAVSFRDQGIEPALVVDLQNIRVLAKNLSTATKPANGAIPFEASLQIKQGGTLRAQGSVTPDQQRAAIKVDARNIALMPLAALLEKHTALKLASGAAYAAGRLDWNGNPAGMRYTGTAGLENFRLAQTTDGKEKSAEAAAQSAQAGALRLQGTVSSNPQRASLKLDMRNIALAPLNPLVAKQITLNIASGAAHAAGQLEWNGDGKTPGLRYTGAAGVDELRLDHEGGGERLFAWKELLAEGIQVDTAQRTARIDQVRLADPTGKIAIAKDRSTNFANLMRKPATDAENTAGTQAKSAASGESPFVVSVERVNVSNGLLDFSDQSLVLPFGAVIREFGGTVTGVSTQPGTRASLKLEGRVDEFGQAQASGAINLLDPKAFTDLVVIFRNVAMSPLTPYSATFAGRRITSGKLSLDLQYKLNNSQLLGENKVLLEQFTLGERVASPTAISLPLDLAIALLTDSNGKIDLSVPVRGNVDRPEFAYGELVWQAIRTVLTNIVTAPFRALASLFGGSAEKVDAIGFEAGRVALMPPEREKLVRVAGVLKQRPQLRLVVEGRYDARHDGLALRTAAARRTLAERQGISLSGPDDPALVNFDNAKTQRAIEALLEERAGKDSIDKFKADYEKSTGKEAKRVNAALALIGKGSSDREFYEALFKRAAELQPLTDGALQELAKQRSSAIVGFMHSSGLDASRTVSKPVATVSADKPAEITSALSLEAGK